MAWSVPHAQNEDTRFGVPDNHRDRAGGRHDAIVRAFGGARRMARFIFPYLRSDNMQQQRRELRSERAQVGGAKRHASKSRPGTAHHASAKHDRRDFASSYSASASPSGFSLRFASALTALKRTTR